MSGASVCSSIDWKAYALGELDRTAAREAETHAGTCAECREELATFRVTLDALSTLREEEIPRRIAFVSDKVFEPRWWQRLFTPNLAAAGVVAVAILVHGFVAGRPASQGGVSQAQQEALIDAKINAAIAQAMAQQNEALQADFEILDKQYKNMYRNTYMVSHQ
jgi:anti-sigma factor RsiW